MSKQVNSESRPFNKKTQISTKPRWLHFSSFGCTLLMVLTIVLSITQLTHNQNTYAVVLRKTATVTATSTSKVKAKGKATVTDKNGTLTFSASIDTSGLPNQTNIVAHLHTGTCNNPVFPPVFALNKQQINSSGKATFQQQNFSSGSTKLDQLIFMFHDGDVTDPQTGKPFVLGCKALTVTNNGAKGTATVANHSVTLP